MSEKNEVKTQALSQRNSNQNVQEIDLAEIFYLLGTHIIQIILITVLGAAIFFLFTVFMITPKYTATSKIYILSNSSSSVVDLSDLQISSQLKSDYQELITSRSILEDVIDNLDLDETPTELYNQVSVTNPTDTRILNISVTTTDPELSADIANELANQSKSYLPEVMKTDAPSVFESAEVPTQKSSPSVSRNTVIGGLIAALIYCAYLIIRHLSNDTFVTPEDINRYFGTQPLAMVPEAKGIHGTKRKGNKKKGRK